jgi:hypothetical protein
MGRVGLTRMGLVGLARVGRRTGYADHPGVGGGPAHPVFRPTRAKWPLHTCTLSKIVVHVGLMFGNLVCLVVILIFSVRACQNHLPCPRIRSHDLVFGNRGVLTEVIKGNGRRLSQDASYAL